MKKTVVISGLIVTAVAATAALQVGCGSSKTVYGGVAATSSSSGVFPLRQVIWVTGNVPAGGDGSLGKPFKTIQAAIDAVPIPKTVTESGLDWSIMIAPGDYDEDLAVTGPVRISLIGIGPWRLGDYSGSSLGTNGQASSTARNIVWTSDADMAVAGGADPQLIICQLNPFGIPAGPGCSTNRISGSLVIKGTSPAKVAFQLSSLEIDAGGLGPSGTSIDVTAYAGQCNSFLRGIRLKGTLLGNTSTVGHIMGVIEFCKFEGLVQMGRYAQISNCAFEGGVLVGVKPAIVGPPGQFPFNRPGGFTDCFIQGTFTGPPDSLVLDDQTNSWVVRNNVVLAGGATKQLNGHAEQTLLTSTPVTLTNLNIGEMVLADPSAGSFAVSLPSATGADGLHFRIKNITTGANTITVQPTAGQLIDNAANRTLGPAGAVDIVAQNGNWWVMAKN